MRKVKGMATRNPRDQRLLSKIRSLPPDRAAEVEDFVDFLHQREREQELRRAVMKAAEPAFLAVWDNPDDADYDAL